MNNLSQKFELHYYLKNDSHSMNAFVRNKAEKNFLEVVKRIGELSNIELKIETEAYQEGGLKEIILIGILALDFLSPTINNTITYYMTRDTEAEALNNENKKLINEGLRLDNQIKLNNLKIRESILKKPESDNPKETSKSEKEINRLDDKITKRYVSEFYKTIDSYEKVEKIGYRSIEEDSEEYIVERKDFKKFILKDDTVSLEDDDAVIEIISPVLKEGKYKWRGKYNSEKIDFSMADSKFKQEVIEGKHKFSNGSVINCSIQIKIIFDEFGDEKSRQYRVSKVFGTKDLELGEFKLREAGKNRNQQKWLDEHQKGLFDDDIEK